MGGYCSIAMDSLNTIPFVPNCSQLNQKTWNTHFNVLKEPDHPLYISGLCYCYYKRYDYDTFHYLVKDGQFKTSATECSSNISQMPIT